MKIEYVRAKNFLCVGEDPLEVDFTQLGNIVLISGRNMDFHDDDESLLEYSESGNEYHSNAAGKSSISEMIVYGLYGSTIRKKVSHTEAIHNKSKKKLEVEVIFTINNVRYRIVRTRKPDTIRLWQDGPPWIDAPEDNNNEITLGGQPATQRYIEESILGMSHKAFVNVVYFGQHNDYNFLECSLGDQRAIAESLLSLEIYKDYLKIAKDELKDLKLELKDMVRDYEKMKESESRCRDRISQIEKQTESWIKDSKRSIQGAKEHLVDIENEMANSDIGTALIEYEKALDTVEVTKESLTERRESEASIEGAIEEVKKNQDRLKEKVHELRLTIKTLDRDIHDTQKDRNKCKAEIKKLDKLPEGAKCPECYGTIDKQHYKHVIKLYENKMDSIIPKMEVAQTKRDSHQTDIDKYAMVLTKAAELQAGGEEKLLAIRHAIQSDKSQLRMLAEVQRPDLTAKELVLEEKIAQTEQFIENKEKELVDGGPYLKISNSAKDDLITIVNLKESQKKKVDETEEIIPYYEYWITAFGDDGIRSFIIEGIVPALNGRISYWMGHLINGKIGVTFDKHLDATIQSSNGDPYAYFATCGGERKRINLAISQAFAHVMMLSSGTWPSLAFLDEVSDSIDQRGIKSIYRMICELSNEKQVFVITHNAHLRKMLDGTDSIVVLRKNGATKRIE